MIGGSRTRTLIGISFAVLLLAASRTAGAQVVTTLAGSRTAGFRDGQGTAASFFNPTAVAADTSGTVYVADTGNRLIRKITPDGGVTTFAGTGSGGYEPTNFFAPTGLAVSASGTVYVADIGDGVGEGLLRKISPDGVVENVWIQFPELQSPSDVAVDGSGTLYVVDPNAGLLKATSAGVKTLLARVRGFWGVAVDRSGNIFVANTDQHTISRVSQDGVVTRFAGSGTPGSADGTGAAASFRGPSGLAVDDGGNVYVADRDNHVVRRITAEGVVSTLAGSGRAGSADGPATAASFHGPTGVALDCAGNLYVADRENQKIRKVTVPGGIGVCGRGGSWIVPSVAHVPGAHGSFWTSDLTLHNRGSVPVSGTLRFLGNGDDTRGSPEKAFTLQPFESVTIPDVLSALFGLTDGYGAVHILCSADRLVVRSRTSTPGPGGTVGDNVPGVPLSAFFTDRASERPVLVGLVENYEFRSNIVLVNGATAPITVQVTASDPSGAILGEKAYTIPTRGMIQDSRFLLRPEFGGAGRSGVTVTISSPTSGALFTALASVIDNGSNDPTTVLPQ